jgi:hypothetical protein
MCAGSVLDASQLAAAFPRDGGGVRIAQVLAQAGSCMKSGDDRHPDAQEGDWLQRNEKVPGIFRL